MSYEQLAASVDALAATNAELVQSIYDGTQLTSGVFADVATGLANTKDGQYFSVVSAENAEYLILYLNSAGVAIEKKVYPSSTAVDDVLELIRESSQASVLDITDDLGFAWGAIKEEGFDLPGMEVAPITEEVTRMLDGEGFVVWEVGDSTSSFGALTVADTPDNGVWVVDNLGFVWKDLLAQATGGDTPEEPIPSTIPSTIPLISTKLFGVQGIPTSLYIRNILNKRSDTDLIRGTISSRTLPYIQTSTDEIKFMPEEVGSGSQAYLYLRSDRDVSSRSRITLTNLVAPNPGTGAGTILTLGDSIQNRQGGQMQKQYLSGWGYTPTFIGTIKGSADAADNADATGELGEAREGWETGDFTYSVTDRVSIVQPGEEAAYMALPKLSKWPINPFLRVATGSDSPSIVRNGMVFDPAFYQTRFSIATPTIVNITLGTNNVRDRSEAEIYDNYYSDMTLIVTQIKAAWPLAKIVLSCPGAPRDQTRDPLWPTRYVPLIKAMLQVRNDNVGVEVFPIWGHVTQEAGYTITAPVTDPLTGAVSGALGDAIHSREATRQQMQLAYAKMMACCISNLL